MTTLPTTFAEFLETYRQDLSEEVLRRLPPLYRMDGERFAPEVARLLRPPFPAQFHAAAALTTMLLAHRAALLVGEPSVGKTITALAAAAMLQARRVLVLAPAHLLAKWDREIRMTIPGAQTVDLQRVRDVEGAMRRPATVDAPLFCLVSRDQAKLGAPWQPVAVPCYLLDAPPFTRYGLPRGLAPRCPSCGAEGATDTTCIACRGLPHPVPLTDRAGRHPGLLRDEGGAPVVAYRCPRCAHLLRDEPDPEKRKKGAKRRLWSEGDFGGGPRRCPFCAEPLVQQQRLRGGRGMYPPARYLGRRWRGAFDLILIDEAHQYKARGTGQGMMLADLLHSGRRVLALTGTLMSGRASSLFYLLHRLMPAFRQEWAYAEAGRFVREYGLVETSREEFEIVDVARSGKLTKRKTIKQTARELPGVTPALLRHVLERTAFIHLRDLGLALPPYKEHAVEVDLSPEQDAAYSAMLAEMKAAIARHYRARRLKLLGGYLQVLLSWPEASWRGDALRDPATGEILATIPALREGVLYPKERALIDLCRREAAAGRRVLVYATHTQTRDITERLHRLLREAGLRADVLRADAVSPRKREAWIRQRAPHLDALVTSPRLVGEGLDLIEFPTIAWVEPEYSTYIVRQASRRSWRITQQHPVDVHYLVYRDTIQTQALALVARGIRAASMVDGEVPDDDSLAGYGEADFFMQLARMVVESTQVRDLDALLRDAAAHAAGQQTFLDPAVCAAAAAATAVPPSLPPPLVQVRDVAVTAHPSNVQLSLF